jgi:hypothetical protein
MIPKITYASIDEAWGEGNSLAVAIPNPYKQPNFAHQLQQQANQTPAQPSVRRILTTAYMRHGLPGVMPYLDPAIVRDIKHTSVYSGKKHNWWENDQQMMFVLLALFAILFAVDF